MDANDAVDATAMIEDAGSCRRRAGREGLRSSPPFDRPRQRAKLRVSCPNGAPMDDRLLPLRLLLLLFAGLVNREQGQGLDSFAERFVGSCEALPRLTDSGTVPVGCARQARYA